MKKIGYFSHKGKFSLDYSSNDITFEQFTKIEELLTFLIKNPHSPYVIFESNSLKYDNKFLEAIFTLNSMLPIFLLTDASPKDITNYKNTYSSIYSINAETTLKELINTVDKNPRTSNRITWPLTAKFFKNPSSPIIGTGNITSLSIGGLYLKTKHFHDIATNDKVYFDIAFMDFSFLVEGEILRIDKINEAETTTSGFNVKFHNISEHTERYITDLINHKLINLIMDDLQT